jgi:hypothetical protein
MNYLKLPLVVLLSLCVSGLLAIVPAAAQGQTTALERGYRTGYSDGFSAGAKDVSEHAPRNYQNKEDYQRANRSFNDVWGPIEDYRDGYQQGFEAGYTAGYSHQDFNSSLPTGLHKRGTVAAAATDNTSAPVNNDSSVPDNNAPVVANGSLAIPRNTILALELLTPVSTDASQRGDRIQAKVVEPAQYAGYIVDGRVSAIQRPGKVKGVAKLQLSFDQISSTDNRTVPLHAELIEISPMGGEYDPQVDSEGGVKGRDSTKDDAAKVGAASGVGAIIGAIAGGGKGAAIGAIIGGGAGTAGVMTQRGKDIRLDRGQHLKIRTSTDTSVL